MVLLPPGRGKNHFPSLNFHWFFVAAALAEQVQGGREHGRKKGVNFFLQNVEIFIIFFC